VAAIQHALAVGIEGATLARQYGVSKTAISEIKLGKTWQFRDEGV
jgi:hypothetical protein